MAMIDERDWNDKAVALDRMISNSLAELSSFLPTNNNLPSRFIGLERHLMYVILEFLKEDCDEGRYQELFIQIPVEDFANRTDRGDDSLQDLTFNCFMGTIEACLQLSTINSYWSQIRLPNDVTYGGDNSNWYHEGDMFLAFKENGECHVLSCSRNNNTGNLMLKYSVDARTARSTIKLYHRRNNPFEYSSIYRISPSQSYTRREINEIKKQISVFEELENCADSKNISRFNKAVSIHPQRYGPINTRIITSSRFFPEIVLNKRDIKQVLLSDNAEIIVSCGLDNYKNKIGLFRNKRPKKIIYIGTETPGDNIPTYEFSFREIYRYCAPSDSFRFEYPILERNIPFQLMTEVINELNSKLDLLVERDENLQLVRRNVLYFLLYFWTDMDFSQTIWEEKKPMICAKLEDVLEHCSQETIDEIVNWVNELRYSQETNPKRTLTQEMCRTYNRAYNILELGKHDSYKRDKIDRLNGYKNLIIIDRASQLQGSLNKAGDSGYKYVLRRCLFANVCGLYYKEEASFAKRLDMFLDREINCYKGEVRRRYHTDIYIAQANGQSVEIRDMSLDNFLDIDSLADSIWGQSRAIYNVTFDNGVSAIIDGTVLVKNLEDDSPLRKENVADLDMKESDYIYYYQCPDNFDELMKIYTDLPNQRSVEWFSKKWQDALKFYIRICKECGINLNTILGDIAEKTFIKKTILEDYLAEDNSRLFFKSSKDMKSMCDFLMDVRQISKDEARYIMAARRFHKKYSEFGKQLKDELFAYKMGETFKFEMVSKIVNNSVLGIDDLMNLCMHEGRVLSINKQ